jgi:hypothetical protein
MDTPESNQYLVMAVDTVKKQVAKLELKVAEMKIKTHETKRVNFRRR